MSARGNAAGADPAAYRSTTTYDDRGQPLLQIDALGTAVRTVYDAVGNPISVTEPGEKTTGTTYDELDRPTSVTRADGSVLRFAYDANGNRASIEDGAGRETTFTYDALDRKVTDTDPAGRTTAYGYDRSGRQTSLVDAGRTTSLSYDAGSQLQQIDYDDGATADYDVLGQRTRMADGTGASTYAYDSLQRLTSATDGAGRQLRYAYDLADRVTKITYPADLVEDTAPAGRTIADPSVTRAIDDAGRVKAITDWLGGRTEYDYDRNGNVIEQRYPNQTKAVMSYDRADRLARRTDTGPGSASVLDLPYTRKTNGQLQTQNRPGNQPPQTETLAYDDLDQLTETATGTGTAEQSYSYVHDVADRLTRINIPDADTTLEYDAANQLVRTRDTNTGQELQTFSFDDVGNRTAQDPAGSAGATTYGYDQASRLTHYQAPAPDPADPDVERDYAYDGDGLRTDLLWDNTGDLPLIVGDSAGLYVTGPDGLPLEQLTYSGQQRYYHHDQLGSTRAITDTVGTVTARYTYDAYGDPTPGSSAADSRFGYAGQHTDHASGLIYMRARWYDPRTGAFLTTDPIGHASGETNLYRYAGGDPINAIDPSGLILGIPGTPSGEDISNFAAGFGDTASFGITRRIRAALGVDYVDYCSSAYGYGGRAATGVEVATGVAGAAKLTGKIGYRHLGRRLADERGSTRLPWAGHRPYAPDRELPRYPSGRPRPDSQYPHTQLGTRKGRYPQSREFDDNAARSGTSTGQIIEPRTCTATRTSMFTGRAGREAARSRCGHDAVEEPLMPMIEIWDNPHVQLADLLKHVSPWSLDWSIMQMWAVALDDKTDVVALERQASESPHGLGLSSEQLQDLAASLMQVIDGVIVGYRGRPPAHSDADLRTSAEVVLEAIDSTFWRVYAQDPVVTGQLRRAYSDVRDVEPETAVPPVHDWSWGAAARLTCRHYGAG